MARCHETNRPALLQCTPFRHAPSLCGVWGLGRQSGAAADVPPRTEQSPADPPVSQCHHLVVVIPLSFLHSSTICASRPGSNAAARASQMQQVKKLEISATRDVLSLWVTVFGWMHACMAHMRGVTTHMPIVPPCASYVGPGWTTTSCTFTSSQHV